MKKAEYSLGLGRRPFIVYEDDGKEEEWLVQIRYQFTEVSELSASISFHIYLHYLLNIIIVEKLKPNDYVVPKKWNQGCYDFV